MEPTTALLIAIGVIAAIVIQFLPRRITGRAQVIAPAVLVFLGVRNLGNGATPISAGASVIAVLVVNLIVAAIFGWLRGRSTRVWTDAGGVAWQQGTRWTAALWAGSVVARVLPTAAGGVAGVSLSANMAMLPLFFGVTLGVQNLLVWYRAQPAALRRLIGGSPSTGS